METQTKIQIGRMVRFFAGYGGTDGTGAIVAVHGTPSGVATAGGVLRVIRADECTVDVILFDGRRLNRFHECGIDAPGIGIKLLDDVLDDVAHLPALAAEREAREALEAAKARADTEAREAARVITSPPLFYYNGIKDAKGDKLQKAWYSAGSLRGYPEGTITIYARDYSSFSRKVAECFAVQNDTDMQTDYFCSDTIRVLPVHPLYADVLKAHTAQEAQRTQRRARKA